MNFIDVFNFRSYFKRSGDGTNAKVGHINAVIEELGYTKTVINISSAEILTMGTTPIELLPEPGVNKYYEFHKIILEFEPGLTPYATSTDLSYLGAPFPYMSGQIYKSFKNVNMAYTGVNYVDTVSGNAFSPASKLNQKLYLTTLDGLDPTDGDGTLRVIVYYKIITFGQ